MTKVKTVKVAASKAPVNKIINEYMIQANKTEMDKQIEDMTMQIEDNVIECQSIIAQLETSNLPAAIVNKSRKETILVRAKEAFEKVRFMSGTLSACVDARHKAQAVINEAAYQVAVADAAIAGVKNQILEYKDLLADQSTTV